MSYAHRIVSFANAIVDRVFSGYNVPSLRVRGLDLGDVGWRAHCLALTLEQRLPLPWPAQLAALARRYRARRRHRVVDLARRWAVSR